MKNDTNMHTQTTSTKSWNDASHRFDFLFKFAFESREQYLEFRREWKRNYAALSKSLHEQKRLVRNTMRVHEYAGTHQIQLLDLKREATVQLAMHAAAKVESNRQYLAAKQIAK
jgi:hypothetical protein